MATIKNIYIEEQPHFRSITSVKSSIPIFIGYTNNDSYKQESIIGKPISISSYRQFQEIFGDEIQNQFQIITDSALSVLQVSPPYFLNQCIRAFFANGGRTCFVLSVNTKSSTNQIEESHFNNSTLWETVGSVEDVDLIVIPDIASTNFAYDIYNQVLEFCASTRYKFLLIDITPLPDKSITETIDNFRSSIQLQHGSYGAAYYPWLNTTLIQEDQLNPTCILNFQIEYTNFLNEEGLELIIANGFNHAGLSMNEINLKLKQLHEDLLAQSNSYQKIIGAILNEMNRIPPSGAIAGVYAQVDNQHGIWKAPANISLSSVTSLTETINDSFQETMNISGTGKSINAIRKFTGKGCLVWGARTIDGNNNEWRYINVRRTVIMIEHSIEHFLNEFIFEPNTSQTWSRIKMRIDNYLFSLWRQGAFQGTKPDHAYLVKIGLGETMTNQDLLNGDLKIEILLSFIRPAEFLVIHFNQKVQPEI